METGFRIRPLTSYLKRSFGVHLSLIFLMAFWSFFWGRHLIKRKAYNLNLIKASVKVDVVAMPKLTFRELRTLEKSVGTPQGERARQEVLNEAAKAGTFIKTKKKLSFQEMMKRMARKKTKGELGDKSSGKILSRAAQKKLRNLVLAGNKVSEGTNFTGTVSDKATKGLAIYMSSLPEKVRPHWRLPSFLKEKGLRCRIRVFLDPRGNLIKTQIIERSGEPEYDKRALEAIKATKFPPLDLAYQSEGSRGAIVLGFPL